MRLDKSRNLLALEKVILKALQGHYSSAKQMRADLLDLMVDKKMPDPLIKAHWSDQTIPKTAAPARFKREPACNKAELSEKEKKEWLDGILINSDRVRSFICLVYI